MAEIWDKYWYIFMGIVGLVVLIHWYYVQYVKPRKRK